jgi:hypothetical protein
MKDDQYCSKKMHNEPQSEEGEKRNENIKIYKRKNGEEYSLKSMKFYKL